MKKLTEHQAKRCEEAREEVCHCRCGGQAHGAKRGGGDAPMSFYYALPEDDPHYTPSPTKRKQLQQEKREAKRKERQARIDEAENAKQEALHAVYVARREGDYDLAHELHEKFMEAYNHAIAVRKGTRPLSEREMDAERICGNCYSSLRTYGPQVELVDSEVKA